MYGKFCANQVVSEEKKIKGNKNLMQPFENAVNRSWIESWISWGWRSA